jgi:hypothetical protein
LYEGEGGKIEKGSGGEIESNDKLSAFFLLSLADHTVPPSFQAFF